MKNRELITLVLLAGATQVTAPALAQTRGGFDVGLEAFDYNYREQLDGETIVRDDGPFIGLRLGYTETLSKGWFLRAQASGAAGSVDYRSNGAIIGFDDGGETRLDNVSQGIGTFELQVGRDFMVSGDGSLTPYVGFATRTLNDDSGGEETENGLLGYDREVVYAYVPVGVALRTPIGARSAFTFTAQYNWIIGGEAEAKFSELDPELPDVKVDLNGGHGLELSAVADFPLGRDMLRVGPFVRRWSIDQSESFVIANPDDPTEAIELFEPKNRTTEWGLRVSFAF